MNKSKPTSHTIFGLPKLHPRYAHFVMPFLLSMLMTCIISLVSTLTGIGIVPGLLGIWMSAWAASWLVAFPTLLIALPFVRKITAAIVDMP